MPGATEPPRRQSASQMRAGRAGHAAHCAPRAGLWGRWRELRGQRSGSVLRWRVHEAGEKTRRRGKVWNGNTRWRDPGAPLRYEMPGGHGPPRAPALLSSGLAWRPACCCRCTPLLSVSARGRRGQGGTQERGAVRVGAVPGSRSRRVLELWIGRGRASTCLLLPSLSPPTLSSPSPSPLDANAPLSTPSSPQIEQPPSSAAPSPPRFLSLLSPRTFPPFLSQSLRTLLLLCFLVLSFTTYFFTSICLANGHHCETVQAPKEGSRPWPSVRCPFLSPTCQCEHALTCLLGRS